MDKTEDLFNSLRLGDDFTFHGIQYRVTNITYHHDIGKRTVNFETTISGLTVRSQVTTCYMQEKTHPVKKEQNMVTVKFVPNKSGYNYVPFSELQAGDYFTHTPEMGPYTAIYRKTNSAKGTESMDERTGKIMYTNPTAQCIKLEKVELVIVDPKI